MRGLDRRRQSASTFKFIKSSACSLIELGRASKSVTTIGAKKDQIIDPSLFAGVQGRNRLTMMALNKTVAALAIFHTEVELARLAMKRAVLSWCFCLSLFHLFDSLAPLLDASALVILPSSASATRHRGTVNGLPA
jgi:hypothetical protein